MPSQCTLDVGCGDAIVIVTRAATLRVDCHRMDGDWSLLLQYRADSQFPAGRENAARWRPLEGQPLRMATQSTAGVSQGGGQPPMGPRLNPVGGRPAGHGEIGPADKLFLQPAKGVFGQMVPCGLLTTREAAKALHICERTLHTLTKSGEIQAVRFGRAVRYDPGALARWIEQRSGKTGP